MGLIELVLGYCRIIRNGRTSKTIVDHLADELEELREELDKLKRGAPPGSDGVIGEAVDVILCAIDIIHHHNPKVTPQTIIDIARLKCDKWLKVYG